MGKFLLVIVLLMFSIPLWGQNLNGENEIGNWVMYFGQNKIADNWSIHSEFQWRNHQINPNLEQTLSRIGVNYHINKSFMLTGGYGYISTHPFDKSIGDITSTEHRVWQQFVIRNTLGRLQFAHRYRYEQRWVNSNFSQRGRYRLLVQLPINNEKIAKGTWFLSAYDEVFLNINRGNVFDRNRLFGSVGYQLHKSTNIQLGFLQQTVSNFAKGYTQLAIFYNPDLRKGS